MLEIVFIDLNIYVKVYVLYTIEKKVVLNIVLCKGDKEIKICYEMNFIVLFIFWDEIKIC